MYKIMALVGEAGSGKDTILNAMIQRYKNILNPIISCTTRPPREGEIDGVNYHFLSLENFTDKVLNDEMLEASCFNNWMYGTELSSLSKNKVNIGVFNPDGIDSIKLNKNIELYVYYIEVSDKERIIRQLNRETKPDIFEIFRRYKTDCEDFSNLNFHYNILNNENDEDFENVIKILYSDSKILFDNLD